MKEGSFRLPFLLSKAQAEAGTELLSQGEEVALLAIEIPTPPNKITRHERQPSPNPLARMLSNPHRLAHSKSSPGRSENAQRRMDMLPTAPLGQRIPISHGGAATRGKPANALREFAPERYRNQQKPISIPASGSGVRAFTAPCAPSPLPARPPSLSFQERLRLSLGPWPFRSLPASLASQGKSPGREAKRGAGAPPQFRFSPLPERCTGLRP